MVDIKTKWQKAKAVAHGMTESEYQAYKKMVHDEEYQQKIVYAKERVRQKYAHKTQNMKSGKGLSMMSSASGILDKLSQAGANVQRNLEREQEMNRAQNGGQTPLESMLYPDDQRRRRRY